ncbi:MAG: carboxypeptidase regulatory-like domain-containing protein [Acidobacteria bacterium]|nr:carboxypeptidase regulatory-like domain-containing protein [Acidobacteriota bacterium]
MHREFFRPHGLKIFALIYFFICAAGASAQTAPATLRGQVVDALGGVLVGVTVTAADAQGTTRSAVTDARGQYVFAALPPGRYTLRVSRTGFTPYENADVEVAAGRTEPLDIVLTVAGAAEEVTVGLDEEGTSVEPENNRDATVLRGADLESLPDDPDDLAEALQALAGPTAGVDGDGQLYIDGFTGGRLPPKESIREIRINRNPFAAEFDRLGYGRIEILTKPGTDQLRGQAFFNFNDESLNSRSPFAAVRAPYQARRYGGNLSGPLRKKKMSFFLDFERRATDDNDEITAIVLDPSFNPVPFYQTLLSPTRRTTFGPRFDWQINPANTLIARYTDDRNERVNEGVGGFNLASRVYDTTNRQQTVQLTETAVLNQSIVNETRFQYVRERRTQAGGSNEPAIRVLDAFTGGGAQIGRAFNDEDRIELQNFTSWTVGRHSFKAGARLRAGWIANSSEQNFAGTYTFGGGQAPQLDAGNEIVRDPDGNPVLVQITSIERYRRTRLFQSLGLSPAEIRARGGGATQFSISGGEPEIDYFRSDFSPFVQDDWRVSPNLTLSFGLRYDWQSDIESRFNFAPRLAFAWAPQFGGGGNQSGRRQRTVLRGGVGIFYSGFNESLLAQTLRFNGVSQQQYLITTATPNGLQFLDLYPSVPTIAQLQSFAVRQTVRRMDANLRTPYTVQSSLGFEHQFPLKTTVSISFVDAATRGVLRSRNVNAPLPGTFVPGVSGSGVRPRPDAGNIFEYESTGRFDQQQLIVGVNTRFSRTLTIRANYVLNRARGDTDGPGSFPVNQYDLSGEYGRSLQDTRHRLTLFGTIGGLPWGLQLNPMLIVNSGRPFNITTGRDLNGDALFTERPAFADAQTPAADLRLTRFGAFDVNPKPGQTIVPRNYGTGASFAVVNLRIGKTFGFGGEATGPATGGNRRGGGRRRGGFGGGGETRSRYNLNFSVNIQNLLNSTNEGVPVGNLSSPFFGVSTNGAGGYGRGGLAAGNRRINLQIRFSF